jgi:hypothetical protein
MAAFCNLYCTLQRFGIDLGEVERGSVPVQAFRNDDGPGPLMAERRIMH